MDGFCCLPLTLFLLHQATATSNVINVTGAVDSSITLVSPNTAGEAVAWSFQTGIIATVGLQNPPQVQFFDTKYEPRLVFPNNSALTIPQLRMDDAGDYTAQNKRGRSIFTLRVYRELEVPTVTCVAQNCSAEGCRYLLHCAATSGSGFGEVSYSWKVGERLESQGPLVLLEEWSVGELQLLTCTTQNPVSSRNVTVSAVAALCTGTSSQKQTAVLAAAMAGLVILSAVIISVIYCKSTGGRIFHLPAAKPKNTEDGEDYRTVYAQVGPSQQSSSNAQENPKKTPTLTEDTSKSIYSTIQALPQTDDEKMGNNTPSCQEQDEKSVYSSVSFPAQPQHSPAVPMNLL